MKLNKKGGVTLEEKEIRSINPENHIEHLFKKGKIKPVETEQEFWSEYKKDKKRISKLFRKSYKAFSNPISFIEEYENILAEMEFKGLVTPEWVQGQRERLYREMNKPDEFKEWVSGMKDRIYNKKDEILKKIKN